MFGRSSKATGPATEKLQRHVDKLPRNPTNWSVKDKERYQELSREAGREQA